MTAVSYDDLVAAATVGLSHRPLHVTGLTGAAGEHASALDSGDDAAALLDAAALMVAARRAGARAAAGVACPAPAAEDTAAELPARAANLLEQARLADPVLLASLLATGAGLGYRAPAPLLPALLDAAVKDQALRQPVSSVLGARGRWLAGHRGDWQRVADAAVADAAVPGSAGDGTAADDPALWETGRRAERRGYLAARRARDPAAARELLAAGWSAETGDDRADLLGVLACGLSAADEEFLETVLDDRKASVRAAGRRLLARLPGSAFTRRAAERAAPLLRLEHRVRRPQLVATRPDRADAAAVRDGITARPPAAAVGPGAWLLIQVISAAPLDGWVASLGLDPEQLVALPVAGGLRVDVHAGWRLAAVDQASSPWAEALLAGPEPGEPSRLRRTPGRGTSSWPPSWPPPPARRGPRRCWPTRRPASARWPRSAAAQGPGLTSWPMRSSPRCAARSPWRPGTAARQACPPGTRNTPSRSAAACRSPARPTMPPP